MKSDAEFPSEITERLKVRRDVENTLAIEVEEKVWYRKKLVFQSIPSADILDFPEMSKRELKILFNGTHQLSQAVLYTAGMIDGDDQIKLQYVKEQSDVLKLEVQSRHISRKVYRCSVKYDPNSIGISERTTPRQRPPHIHFCSIFLSPYCFHE